MTIGNEAHSWGCGLEGDYAFYSPYQKVFPRDQVILLSLWDELGIPHCEPKQIHGPEIPIIGINVDVNELTFALTAGAKDKLIEELQWWCKPGRKEKLCQWYQVGGWVNWALNVYPRLRPAAQLLAEPPKNNCYSQTGTTNQRVTFFFFFRGKEKREMRKRKAKNETEREQRRKQESSGKVMKEWGSVFVFVLLLWFFFSVWRHG